MRKEEEPQVYVHRDRYEALERRLAEMEKDKRREARATVEYMDNVENELAYLRLIKKAAERIVAHEDYAEEDMAVRRQWCTDVLRVALDKPRLYRLLTEASVLEERVPYVCANCKASGVKLWREYQTIAPQLLCGPCTLKNQGKNFKIEADGSNGWSIGWYVPAVVASDGNYWGIGSISEGDSEEDFERWKALPLEVSDG